jgi:hypothetical protein
LKGDVNPLQGAFRACPQAPAMDRFRAGPYTPTSALGLFSRT